MRRHERAQLLACPLEQREVRASPSHPGGLVSPQQSTTAALVRRVAGDLAVAGWKPRSGLHRQRRRVQVGCLPHPVAELGAKHRFMHAGRPRPDGSVEAVQRTILKECWRPSVARSLVPTDAALQRERADCLALFNFERAHDGRYTQARTPAEVVCGARKMRPG